MDPTRRRQAIIDDICRKQNVKMSDLSAEFGVSIRTIQRDIDNLSLTYPLITNRSRYRGGVSILPGYRPRCRSLSNKQTALLERLLVGLDGEDRKTLQSVLSDFSPAAR